MYHYLHENLGGLNGKKISRKPKHGEGYDTGEGSSRQMAKPTRRATSTIIIQEELHNNSGGLNGKMELKEKKELG